MNQVDQEDPDACNLACRVANVLRTAPRAFALPQEYGKIVRSDDKPENGLPPSELRESKRGQPPAEPECAAEAASESNALALPPHPSSFRCHRGYSARGCPANIGTSLVAEFGGHSTGLPQGAVLESRLPLRDSRTQSIRRVSLDCSASNAGAASASESGSSRRQQTEESRSRKLLG